MKKTTTILLLMLVLTIVFAQPVLFNETNQTGSNETLTNDTSAWYEEYTSDFTSGDNLTILTVIIGLILVYVFGKIAFKIIKWAIIILLVILVLKVILF